MSQQKRVAAKEMCLFQNEMLPVEIPGVSMKDAPVTFDTDEHPRPDTTLEKLAKLKPAFAKDDPGKGTVTAGSSSGVNDGAAALLLVEEKRAKQLGLTPLAFVGPSASAGRSRVHGAGAGLRHRARRCSGRSSRLKTSTSSR